MPRPSTVTTVRTLATHQLVRELFPRPVTERDERAMVEGRVIDETLSRCSHEARLGRRPTTTALLDFAAERFDTELADAVLPEDAAFREASLARVAGVLRAFRASVLFGLPRPRSRWILVNGEVGLYAQPDFWDGRARIFEMKSYRPLPVPPDVALQVRCFQLAFPRFEAFLVGFDRHRVPVETTVVPIAPPRPEEVEATLREVLRVGRAQGTPKVLEYLEPATAAYTVAPEGPGSPGPGEGSG